MGILSDASWPTSGTPTAGNTGFSTLTSSGTLMFEVDENGDKYVTTTAANVTLNARLDATANVFASGETRYQVEYVIYAEFAGASDSNTVGTPSGFCLYLSGPGGSLSTLTLNALNAYTVGLAPSIGGSGGSTAGGACSGFTAASPTVGGKECIPINAKVGWGIFGDRTAGVIGLLMNGTRVGTWTVSPANNVGTDFTVQLPAVPGIRWRIYSTAARPCRSYTGTSFDFSPQYSYAPMGANDGLQYSFPHIAVDGLHGNFWTYTGTVTLTEYSTVGGNVSRKRVVGGAGGFTATTRFALGTPVYNEFGDYAIATWFFVPSTKTYSIAIRNAGDSADLLKFQVSSGGQFQNGAGTQLQASDGTAITIAADRRYLLIINVSKNGYASWSLEESLDNLARRAFSNQISGGWTPQALGKIVVTGDAATEADRVDCGPWLTKAICDSLSVAYETAVTPYMPHTANNIGYGFPHSDGVAIPGIAYHNQQHGWPKESWLANSGRSGRQRAHWISYVRDYLTHVRALRIVALDGGCWNDIVQAGATAVTLLSYVSGDLSWCASHNCQLVVMPSFDRPKGLAQSMTTAQRNQRLLFNALQEAWVISNEANSRLFYCPSYLGYRWLMRSTDGVHPANDILGLTRAISSTRMTARQFANLQGVSRKTAGSATSGGGVAALSAGSGVLTNKQ